MKTALGAGDDEVAAALARRLAEDGLIDPEVLQRLSNPEGREAFIRSLLESMTLSVGVEPGRYGLVDNYPDAVGAAIRSALTFRELYVRDDAAAILTGAIRMALLLADPGNDGPLYGRNPWRVQYPRLLDPLILFALEVLARSGPPS